MKTPTAVLPFLLLACPALAGPGAREVVLRSPDEAVVLRVAPDESGRLAYSVTLAGRPVIERSALGVRVDGTDLGQGSMLGPVERYSFDERFPWRGVHSTARNRGNGARVAATHAATGTSWIVELRVFDDAAAFRFVVPGTGKRVPDAASAFQLPAGSTVWYHGARDHYEGMHVRKELPEVPAGDWAAPPLTIRLPGGAGYAAITEAALFDYAGMMLQADGQGGFLERLGHAVPPSYPYTLRYGEENAKRLAVPARHRRAHHDTLAGGVGRTGSEHAGQQRRDREPQPASRPATLPSGHADAVAAPGARGLALPRRPVGRAEAGGDGGRARPPRLRDHSGLLASGRGAGLRAPRRRGSVAEVLRGAAPGSGRVLEGAGRLDLGLGAQPRPAGRRGTPEAVRPAPHPGRRRDQGRLPRPRGEGDDRPLPGDPEGRGRAAAARQLPRGQQAHRGGAHVAERDDPRRHPRPRVPAHAVLGGAQRDAPLHSVPGRPGRLHAARLRRAPQGHDLGPPDRDARRLHLAGDDLRGEPGEHSREPGAGPHPDDPQRVGRDARAPAVGSGRARGLRPPQRRSLVRRRAERPGSARPSSSTSDSSGKGSTGPCWRATRGWTGRRLRSRSGTPGAATRSRSPCGPAAASWLVSHARPVEERPSTREERMSCAIASDTARDA